MKSPGHLMRWKTYAVTLLTAQKIAGRPLVAAMTWQGLELTKSLENGIWKSRIEPK